jgi:hypothetical protein
MGVFMGSTALSGRQGPKNLDFLGKVTTSTR